LLDELLEGFGRCYEHLKRERGAVDFDDLELCARELLEEHESVRGAWAERFELLMLDEFQDTNPRQLAILKALERGNLFTGGSEALVELLLTSRLGWDDDGAPAASRWRHAEARMLARRVAELVESGEARAGEVVVLLRSVGDLEVYERALQERGLRTLAAVGG